MFSGKYTNINRVVENILRDIGYSDGIILEDAIEWAVRAMNLIGAPLVEEIVVEDITITDFRATIPTAAKEILGLRNKETKIPYISSTDEYIINLSDIDDLSKVSLVSGLTFQSTTVPTYKVVNGYIFTNVKEDTAQIKYSKYMLDNDGFIMIPDEDRYLMAIEAYITYKIDSIMYRRGLISRDIKFESEQNWLWYVNSAFNKIVTPSYDQAESMKNQINKMRSDIDSQSRGFGSLNYPTIKKF